MALHNNEDSDSDIIDANANNELAKHDLERYQLWHDRCVHAGPEK
jgi:hypothetical protein